MGLGYGRMFADIKHFTSLIQDAQHHFEGYTRADGQQFDGGSFAG
jgi:hypothetical protein